MMQNKQKIKGCLDLIYMSYQWLLNHKKIRLNLDCPDTTAHMPRCPRMGRGKGAEEAWERKAKKDYSNLILFLGSFQIYIYLFFFFFF
jgi:hypothetical protein